MHSIPPAAEQSPQRPSDRTSSSSSRWNTLGHWERSQSSTRRACCRWKRKLAMCWRLSRNRCKCCSSSSMRRLNPRSSFRTKIEKRSQYKKRAKGSSSRLDMNTTGTQPANMALNNLAVLTVSPGNTKQKSLDFIAAINSGSVISRVTIEFEVFCRYSYAFSLHRLDASIFAMAFLHGANRNFSRLEPLRYISNSEERMEGTKFELFT
mmetsp:Transcript_31625/g.43156  ORF Transcript_31625/g.43156 Transcript_31625/m.43156 type:complete len:208 (+) Transcript_31625:79-702(+)